MPRSLCVWRARAGEASRPRVATVYRTLKALVEHDRCEPPSWPQGPRRATEAMPVCLVDLVIADTGTITDLNLYIKATHTWVGDLRFSLTKVSGPTITPYDRPGVPASTFGCNSDNLDSYLDDEAGGGPVETACPVAAGVSYTPNSPLSGFDGQTLNGTWRLNAADLAASDTGTLVQWCIAPAVVPTLTSDGFESGTLGAWNGYTP